MKTKFNVILTLFLTLFVQMLFAQDRTITGTVSDDMGPVPQVSILKKGTVQGVETDFDGNYSIQAKTGDVLIFSFIGMKTQEVTIGKYNKVDVTLESVNLLDEVVVVAYGTTTKEALTGSASVIDTEDLALRNVTSPLAAVEGKATGIQFTSTSGQPGSTPNIVIRGVGTLNGGTSPLFIVDGVQYSGSLSSINQEDIASFTVLKDAASTSLYGSRAANGVVIITTKSGKIGQDKVKVNASLQSGIVTRATSLYDRVSPSQYYEVMWEALKNSSAGNGDPSFASQNIYSQLAYNPFNVPNDQIVGVDGKINPNAQVIFKNLNWFNFMERVGYRKNYNANISAGGKNHDVFFSTSYLNEDGYVLTSSFDRLTARLNSNFNVNDNIKIGGSANVTISEVVGPSSAGASSAVNPFRFSQRIGSIYPLYVNDQNGNIVKDDAGNPLFDNGEGFPQYNIGPRPERQGRNALQELLLNDERDQNNTYGFRLYGDVKLFLDGLRLKIDYGRDINENLRRRYENAVIGDAQPDGRYQERRLRRDVKNFIQTLNYNKNLGNHNLDITLGHESYKRTSTRNSGRATGEVASGIFEFNNFANLGEIGGFSRDKSVEGYFFRTNYNFDNKYFLSASFRRDASSVFFSNSRWGNFYSFGASWSVHKENFMKNVSFVDRLKLRASWGEVGNDNLAGDDYLSKARFGLNSNAGDGAFVLSDLGNRNLKWETVENLSTGIEFTLFNNFLDGSVEYYKRNSTDLLYNVPKAPSNGINIQPDNIGDMFNAGWEVSLTGHLIKKSDFKWDLTLQASTLKNEITFVPTPFINGTKRWAEGRSRYDFFLYRTAGVDPQTGDQLYYKYEEDPDTGESVPVLDANGDIEVTNSWRNTVRAYTGDSSIPDLLGSVYNSMDYKGISLNFLITYGVGGKILDSGYSALMHSGIFGRAVHPDLLNAWKTNGDITNVPRLENGNTDLVNTSSDRFLTDASFWALKNVSLGYNFNKNLLTNLGLDNLRLSVTGENLFLHSKRKGLDPQYNISGTQSGDDYNPSRLISLGLNVSF